MDLRHKHASRRVLIDSTPNLNHADRRTCGRRYDFKSTNELLDYIFFKGFKSYPVRTQITGWDPSFNAITGLNGSGKSNILDAICFVLGITNMSQVSTDCLCPT